MPRIVLAAAARAGLRRCRQFLEPKNLEAATRAGAAIARHFDLLRASPELGRPSASSPELRELLIPFGDSGYVALYGFDPSRDEVIILAFRHQKEAGY